jgi:endonuclease/exonuclease/phosphatase family metal-dependent hydrolase
MSSRTLLALLAVSSLFGCGQKPLDAREPDPGMAHFTIATFNVLDDDATNPATVDAIGKIDADILALQEVTPALETILREKFAAKYPYMIFHPSDAAGIGAMSRFPMKEGKFMELTNGWHPSLELSVETPAGKLEILQVHLHAPEGNGPGVLKSIAETPQDHRNEMELFTAQCAEPPKIVLGDFNEDGAGAGVKMLEDRGYVNALPLYHPGQFTWKGKKSVGGQFQAAYDHIMFSKELEPLNSWIGPNGASDHIPVMASFQAKPW